MSLSYEQAMHLEKLNRNQKNENNRNWKGDKAGYKAIHHWVRTHLSKPDICPHCKIRPVKEVVNLDGKCSRDLTTWKWLCTSCRVQKSVENKKKKQK